MSQHKKAATVLTLVSLAIIATAATIRPASKFRNLKVLPQDISEKQLDSFMEVYSKALKVSCDFCHAAPKNLLGLPPASDAMDFAADNEMKENARRMMRMTIDINKTHFNFDSTKAPLFLNVITCNTCHRGNPFPAHE